MVEITKQFENNLLKRKEITANLETQGATISREEAKKQLANKLKADEELMIIEEITSHFGSKKVTVSAFLYENKEALEKITLKHIIKRNQPPKEAEEQEA